MITEMLDIEKPKIDRHRQLLLSFGRCLTYFPQFIQRFYEILKDSHPEIRQKFENTDDAKQIVALRRVFNIIIMFDQGEDMAKQVLDKIRKSHGKSGLNIKPELYKFWTNSLLQAISEADPNYDRDLQEQWQRVVTKAANYVSTGHEDIDESTTTYKAESKVHFEKESGLEPQVLKTLNACMPDLAADPKLEPDLTIRQNTNNTISDHTGLAGIHNDIFTEDTQHFQEQSTTNINLNPSFSADLDSFEEPIEANLHTLENINFDPDFHSIHEEEVQPEDQESHELYMHGREPDDVHIFDVDTLGQQDIPTITGSSPSPSENSSIPQLDDEFAALSFDEEDFTSDSKDLRAEIQGDENIEQSEFDQLEFTEFPKDN